MLRISKRRMSLIALACSALMSAFSFAQTAATLNVPAGELGAALKNLATQADIELVYLPEQVRGLRTEGLQGTYSPQEAVMLLLKGTSLQIHRDSSGAIVISAPDNSSAAKTSANGVERTASETIRLSQAEASSTEAAPPVASAQDASRVEEIVVTAQKRNQSEQDVPTSMVALSAAKLEAQGVNQLSDLTKQVPGLMMIGGGAGPGIGKPVLRGISTGTDRNALVGIYLDDVSFTPSSTRSFMTFFNFAFDPSLADVEHIEVLKGPQSTLYGASALGGLIKYVTKRPDLNEFEGSARIDGSQTESAGSGYGMRASVNIPLVTDRVAVRLSGFYRENPGYVDEVFHDVREANSDTSKGGRFSLLAKLTDNLETTFTGLAQDIKTDASYAVFLNSTTFQPSLGRLANASPVEQGTESSYRALSNTTVLTLPFGTLTNIASFAKLSGVNLGDSSSLAPFLGLPAGSGISVFVDPVTRRYSDELRLASAPNRLEWLLGGFYVREKNKYDPRYIGTDANGVYLPTSSPFYDVATQRTTGSFEERAIFGDVTYHFTDRLEGTVGARHSTNDQDFTLVQSGLLGPLNQGHPTSDSATNYLATVSFKPQNNLTLYVRAASAYRPGGPNALNNAQLALGLPRGFDADTLWNYEAGVKGSVWNQLLTYSAAVYHMDWSDIQINVRTIINGQPFSTTGNAASARSDGAELALHLTPVTGLSIGLSGAYNEAKITSDAPTLGARDGNRLPYSPKVSLSSLVDYRFPLSNIVTANMGLTFASYSDQRTGFQNGVTYRLPSYETLDLRTGIDWSNYSLVLRADNVTDQYALTDVRVSTAAGSPLIGTVIRPRTYGLAFEARF